MTSKIKEKNNGDNNNKTEKIRRYFKEEKKNYGKIMRE